MKIEKRLKQLSNENPNYSLLWAQWEFDKKLLSRALNSISRDFPHYSLHDASHSSTIITQIEKVIAPNIDKLSATDCWLLLESCYWHDAGMIITNEEKKRLLQDDDFVIYLKELSERGGELSLHAREVLESKQEDDILKALQISNSLTFLISDYFRKLHADRSGLNVSDPSRVKIHSPRTSLIPQRLFNFVSQIVQCHGKQSDDILKLAKYNDGMDAEDYAHPRYIAALLRIGDLLDIDDGRFCPTLLANIGDVPLTSKHHQEKHASIKHLFINSEVIEIRAECEHYGAYHAQQAWFNYIQNEFDYQKRVWIEIVPDSDYRALPTIGLLSCEIKGYIAIEGRIPKISLDSERVYDYITGSLIYSEKYPFSREIIQNAIDATFYKIWSDFLDESQVLIHSDVELRKRFNDELSKYRIEIYCNEDANDETKDLFSVRDYGTGMDLDDIKKMLVVGSESVSYRKKINREIPDWGKPSGYFGIGLQTVFKLCSKVTIKTRKKENPCYFIEVNNRGDMDFIEVSIKEIDERKFEGTEVTACFAREGISILDFDRIDESVIDGFFDPLIPNENSIFKQVLLNTLRTDFLNNTICLTLNSKQLDKIDRAIYRQNDQSKLIKKTDFELGVDFELFVDIDDNSYSFIDYKYKGVEFASQRKIFGLGGEIDIFKNNAGYWLTIDRKKGRIDRKHELTKIVDEIIQKHHQYIYENTNNKTDADFFIYCKTGVSHGDEWKNYKINNESVLTLLFENKTLSTVSYTYGYYQRQRKFIHVESLQMMLLAELYQREKFSLQVQCFELISEEDDNHGIQYDFLFTNDKQSTFTCETSVLIRNIETRKNERTGRTFFPCYKKDIMDIAIKRSSLPKFIFSQCTFNRWASDFIVTPQSQAIKTDAEMKIELEIVYQYYSKHRLLKLDEFSFKQKYEQVWTELGFITIDR